MSLSGNSARSLAHQALRHRAVTQFIRPTSSGNTKSQPPHPTAAAAVNIVANFGKDFIEMVKYIPSNIYNKMQISSSDPPTPPPTPKKSSGSEEPPGAMIGGEDKGTISPFDLIAKESPTTFSPPPTQPPIPPPSDSSSSEQAGAMPITTGFPEKGMNWQHLEARTRYLVGMLEKHVGVSPAPELIHHVEALFSHIFNHDGTREVAIHRGVYKMLFKILKLHETDVPIVHRTRELLAILGYNEPVRGRGIRILSLDGGGIR